MIICKKPRELHDLLEKKKLGSTRSDLFQQWVLFMPVICHWLMPLKKQNKIVVCSIFVNPTQFNDPQDFKKYPITLEKDILMFEGVGCDVLFIPSVEDIYPKGTNNLEHYDLGFLETVLEGKFRPGHFQGVCLVMGRLLEIVLPNNLYLGQKDYQQCMVIKKLIELIGLKDK
jgi:pantoate--beta-alanine ligase